MIEMTFFQAFFVALAWAWSCLGRAFSPTAPPTAADRGSAVLIAHKSRRVFDLSEKAFGALAASKHAGMGLTAAQISSAVSEDIFHGVYLEVESSAVCGIFLGVGCGYLVRI